MGWPGRVLTPFSGAFMVLASGLTICGRPNFLIHAVVRGRTYHEPTPSRAFIGRRANAQEPIPLEPQNLKKIHLTDTQRVAGVGIGRRVFPVSPRHKAGPRISAGQQQSAARL